MTDPTPVTTSWADVTELPDTVRGYLHEDQWRIILAVASDVLWAATGRQFRGTTASETVTLDTVDVHGPPAQHFESGLRVGTAPFHLHPGRADRVRLPRPDVTDVTEVAVRGAVMGDGWRRNGNWVIRTDGRGWPISADTRISYTFGRYPTSGGKHAALLLAAELGSAAAGKQCQLPQRLASVARQGITFAALDDMEFLDGGLTGVYAVDLWIRSVNPAGLRARPAVWSPDIVTGRKV